MQATLARTTIQPLAERHCAQSAMLRELVSQALRAVNPGYAPPPVDRWGVNLVIGKRIVYRAIRDEEQREEQATS